MIRVLLIACTLALAGCVATEKTPDSPDGCAIDSVPECRCEEGEAAIVCLDGGKWLCQCGDADVEPADAGTPTDDTSPSQADTNGGPCLELLPSRVVFDAAGPGETMSEPIFAKNCSDLGSLQVISSASCWEADGVCDSTDTLVLSSPDGLPVTLAPGESTMFDLAFSPVRPGEFTGFLAVEADSVRSEIPVSATVGGDCRTDLVAVAEASVAEEDVWSDEIVTVSRKTIKLRSRNSTGPAASFEWSVVESPPDAIPTLMPYADVPAPTIFVTQVGRYVVELRALDESGLPGCEPARVVVFVGAEFMVELTWDTPTDSVQNDAFGTDLDLHFLHPNGTWNAAPFDIYWLNPTADWGATGPADDPTHGGDDSDGVGPETVSLETVEDVDYSIGAYYYADNGYGPSYGTVRVFVRGALTYEYRDMFMPSAGTFWYAAVMSPSSGVQVTAVNNVQQGFPNR